METTLAQKQVLKTWLEANAVGQSDQQAADSLNANATPDYFVLKPKLGRHDLTDVTYIGDDGIAVTSFVWGGAQLGNFILRSAGERDAYNQLFNATDQCTPTLANVRTAYQDIFSGAGAGAVANRDHFRAASRRQATVAEKLLAVVTVGGPVQTGARGARTNPDTMGAVGLVTPIEVEFIRTRI